MTREEAIKIIDCYDINFYDLSGEKIPANKLAEAFDMAIEALSAEPSGDLISRADAIEAVCEECDVVCEHRHETIQRIATLPSADAVDVAHDIPEYCSWSQTYTNMVQSAMSKASANAVPRLKQTDTLIIADALRYLAKDTERHLSDRTRADALRQQFLKYGASMSADAVQGEWVYGTDPITGEKDCIAWTCSLCGGKYPWQPNYCPNCGARMKGGAE